MLESRDLIIRLIAAIPPPRFHLARYFGVLSSHSKFRSEVVPKPPVDLFLATIPYAETRQYVERVMTNWIRYTYLAGDEEVLPKVSLTQPSAITIDTDAY